MLYLIKSTIRSFLTSFKVKKALWKVHFQLWVLLWRGFIFLIATSSKARYYVKRRRFPSFLPQRTWRLRMMTWTRRSALSLRRQNGGLGEQFIDGRQLVDMTCLRYTHIKLNQLFGVSRRVGPGNVSWKVSECALAILQWFLMNWDGDAFVL